MDMIVNILVTAEVAIRIIAITSKVFFKSIWNILDLVLMALFWVFSILEIVEVSNQRQVQHFFLGGRTALIVIRCSIRILRTIRIVSV